MKKITVIELALAAVCLSACGTNTSPAAADTLATAHFTFRYTSLDRQNIDSIAAALEREHARIVSDLAPDGMPRVNVTFYADHAQMETAARPIAGVIPSWASGLATSAEQIHLMSPNLPAYAPVDRMIANLVHEFAHCVSMRINARIPNNPRWLWETVAIYESRQAVDPKTLSYMTSLSPPSLAALNSLDDTRIYQVGYTIGEFIVARGGSAALRTLVTNSGDVQATLGMTPTQFEVAWFAFARGKYGF